MEDLKKAVEELSDEDAVALLDHWWITRQEMFSHWWHTQTEENNA